MNNADYAAHWKRMNAIEGARNEIRRWSLEVEYLEAARNVAWFGERLGYAQAMLAHYTAKLIELRSTA